MMVLETQTSVPVGPRGCREQWSHVKQGRRPLTACSLCPFGTELVSVFVFFSDVSELLTSRNWVLCIFLDTGNLLKGKAAAPGGSRWRVAGAEGGPSRHRWEEGRCVGSSWRRERLLLRRAGEAFQQQRSQPCLTAVPSSLPRQPAHLPDTKSVGYHAPGFECPRPPSSAMCFWLGSWLPARLGVPGRVALAACSPLLTAWGWGGGMWGTTPGSSVSCAEATSFARRAGSLGVSSPMLRSSSTEARCPQGAGGKCSGRQVPSGGRDSRRLVRVGAGPVAGVSTAWGMHGCLVLAGTHLSVLSRDARAGERNLHISSMYIIFRRGRGESLGPLITFILLPLDCWLCM
ncbi:uncharacterized protein LOC121092430 [Falco naumanni]|uniref:uncharacterized protein LOC121092430 n=1 Tax=Falco naumanni TaxID=148594 RepID=UPI001ADE51EE|nr:uncharacterized protein LOC121092430 [Falco naumanni]